MTEPSNRPRPRRGGYTMIVVLALAALATTMSVGWARTALREHRSTLDRHARAQADWLVHAGFGRAVARLRADPGYRGETWPIAAGELGRADAAEVRIDVARGAGGATITCRVRLPPGDERRVQLTRSLPLPAPGKPPAGANRTPDPDRGTPE